MKKRLLAAFLAAAAAAALAGCGAREADPEKLLYEKGLALTIQMDTLAQSEGYRAAISSSPELDSALREIGARDYGTPRRVFAVDGGDEAFAAALKGGSGVEFTGEVAQIVKERMLGSIASMVNAQSGVSFLAAASCLSVRTSFLSKGQAEQTIYLYLYDGDYGSLVVFTPREDGIVDASANLIGHDLLKGVSSPEEARTFFTQSAGLAGLTVTEVKIPA